MLLERTFYKKSHISSMLDYYISRVVNSSNIVTNSVDGFVCDIRTRLFNLHACMGSVLKLLLELHILRNELNGYKFSCQ